MKKKKLLQVPPIPLRGKSKAYYKMVADARLVDDERHLICDIYERDIDSRDYTYIMRAVYTPHDWALYYPRSGQWSRASICNCYRKPVWDHCDMISGPGIPKSADWKNTQVDDKTLANIVEFCKEWAGSCARKDRKWESYILDLEREIKAEREEKEMVSREEKLRQRIADMPAVPEDFGAWADEKLYRKKEFVYYKRKGRKAECTCSACGAKYTILTKRSETFEGQFEDVHPVPANDIATRCLHCGAEATYKPIGRCKYDYGMIIDAYLIQPFRKDGAVIRFWEMHKEWSTTAPSKIYGVEIGRVYFGLGRVRTDWHLRSCISGKENWYDHNVGGMYNISMKPGVVYTGNAEEWEKTRALRYSGLKEYIEKMDGPIRPGRYMETAEKFPLERLVKMGLLAVANEIINCGLTGRDPVLKNQWSRKAGPLLGIRPCRLSLLQEMNGDLTLLRILQAEKMNTEDVMDGVARGKGEWTEGQIAKLHNLAIDKESLLRALSIMSVTKFLNRVEKYCGGTIPDMLEGWESSCRAQRCREVAKLYLDYIRLRQEGGYGLERSTDQAPRDLWAAHRAVVEAKNKEANEKRLAEIGEKYEKIKKRYRKLKRRYGWQHDGILIRPAKDAREIIEEGQCLHHCVGNGDFYISRHNNGTSFILFVRDAKNPNQPYITLEVDSSSDRIIQWYGRNDTKPDKEKMEAWLKEWKKDVKERKQRLEEAAASAAAPASVDADNILIAAG